MLVKPSLLDQLCPVTACPSECPRHDFSFIPLVGPNSEAPYRVSGPPPPYPLPLLARVSPPHVLSLLTLGWPGSPSSITEVPRGPKSDYWAAALWAPSRMCCGGGGGLTAAPSSQGREGMGRWHPGAVAECRPLRSAACGTRPAPHQELEVSACGSPRPRPHPLIPRNACF